MNHLPKKIKVLAYIVRKYDGRWQLLIFKHRDFPKAGLQVPGGTVDEDESPEMAVVREVNEESGLTNFQSIFFLGRNEFFHHEKSEIHQRNFFALIFEQESITDFEHQVTAGIEDTNLVFIYTWYDLENVPPLAGEQDAYLPNLKVELSKLE